MKPNEFFAKYDGKGIDVDGAYGNQCMDVFLAYEREVTGGKSGAGNAVDMWELYDKKSYERHLIGTREPLPGDVVIWGKETGPYGHIAVFVRKTAGGFDAFGQNWPVSVDSKGNGTGVAHYQLHTYAGVLGFLRPIRLIENEMTETEKQENQNYRTFAKEVQAGSPLLVRVDGYEPVYAIYHIPSYEHADFIDPKLRENIVLYPRSMGNSPADWGKLQQGVSTEENLKLAKENEAQKKVMDSLKKAVEAHLATIAGLTEENARLSAERAKQLAWESKPLIEKIISLIFPK